MAECKRTVFTATVTRITADWCNAVDKLLVAIGCAENKSQAQAALDIVPRSEYEATINNLQSQINNLQTQIDVLEACLPAGYCFQVVTALPATPDANIIYFVTG